MSDDPRLRPFPHETPPKDEAKPELAEVLVELRDLIRAQTEVNRSLLRFLTGVSE